MNINEVMISNILFNLITKTNSFNEGIQIVILTSLFYYISKINFKTEFFENFFISSLCQIIDNFIIYIFVFSRF